MGLELKNNPVFFTVFVRKVWNSAKFAPPSQVNPTIFFPRPNFHHPIYETFPIGTRCGCYNNMEDSMIQPFTMVNVPLLIFL